MKVQFDIRQYPYGRTRKVLTKAIDWIESNIENIQDFDFPDYGGMPKQISYKLYPDEVDWIQTVLSIRYTI